MNPSRFWLDLFSRLRTRLFGARDDGPSLEAGPADAYDSGEDFPEEIEWYPIEGAPWEEACDGAQSAFGECDDFFD
ncbi:hypothetical protein Ocepr_2280 (plasmid) [Oceanithermus profundus DSM 14977]|uniref:Uncharacterized protein n=1 Tax=Oceanithermus profundus (strain DSM 14977 / NBRC 100410 / VKM B-2274 / 506) TaxID=670487 RepID=E4UAU3_OCEP5|nr:hypothetical protein [Oceanithermus profundus]ADR37728.1 hypothetical protein Ocepr_2280 [Oceanithermus profundus DSM 14977]